MWSLSENRFLIFKEVFDSPISNFAYGFEYDKAGIKVVNNSPEDIRDVVLEMIEHTEGIVTYTAEDERLQARFNSLMRPEHLSYEAGARISREFLRKYAGLLGDKTP